MREREREAIPRRDVHRQDGLQWDGKADYRADNGQPALLGDMEPRLEQAWPFF